MDTERLMDALRMRRGMQARAFAGLDPTDDQRMAYEAGAERRQAAGDNLGTFGRELTGMPQVMRAGNAILDAYNDPGITSMTNAGMHAGLALLRPAIALKSLGAGYGAAATKDMGLLSGIIPKAKAADAEDPLDAGSRTRLKALQDKQGKGQTLTRAEREEQNAYLKVLSDAASAAATSKAAAATSKATEAARTTNERERASILAKAESDRAGRAEYDRAVRNAETVRDTELARQRRFSDTETGRLWDKTGGIAPAIGGLALGGLSRLASGGGSRLNDVYMPAATGAMTGAFATNVPLAYNAFFTEPDNPERRAYEAYARELPPTHPRRQEWMDYASRLPSANPIRATASDELYNPVKAVERMFFGGIEGAAGGLGGAHMAAMPRRAVEMAARSPGVARAGYQGGMAEAELAELARLRQAAELQQARAIAAQTPAAPALPPSIPIAPPLPSRMKRKDIPPSADVILPPGNQRLF